MRSLAAPAVVFTCAWLAACGGSGGDRGGQSATRPPTSDAEQAAATVREQAQAVARGDGAAACGFLSPGALKRVTAIVSERTGGAGCGDAVSQAATSLPAELHAALARPSITAIEVHGDRATVKLALPAEVPAAARAVGRVSAAGTPLRKIDGRWKVDGLTL